MTIIRKLSTVLIAATAFSLTACGDSNAKQSVTHNDDHSAMEHHDMDKMPRSDMMKALAMGRVISVNQASGMVTIEHGPVKALDWPTMTMPFMVDSKHLISIKKGDFVDMEMMGKPNQDGKYVLTNIGTINIDRSKLPKACVSMMDNIKSLDQSCMADIREAMPHGH